MHYPPRHRRGMWLFVWTLVVMLGAVSVGTDEAVAARPVEFNLDIRPILSDNCFECHGPDEQKNGLRFDLRDSAIGEAKSGERAVVPGDPDASELIRRVTSDDPDERMPADHDPLTAEQIETLRRWIEQGAEWQAHWAFEPVQRHDPPEVERSDWPRNPIDRFILARLEEEGIAPSPEADRYTLIRRLYIDLLGLPPAPEEVDRFVNDDRPGAYERLVDRVLDSPHYGERWGRHWLDQARYADSHGYSIDSERSMWPYRDWVIDAINKDMPFDQFTIEQLAGDLLEDPTTDQLVATGFHRNTLVNQEGGSDPEQFRAETVVDRTNTTGAVWLGLTVACAQCHTHKFDPITHEDYFELYAFFNSTEDKNSVAPAIRVPTAEQEERLAEFNDRIAETREALRQRDAELADRRGEWEEAYRQRYGDASDAAAWAVLEPTRYESTGGSTLTKQGDQSVLAEGENPSHDAYEVVVSAEGVGLTAVRLETLTHPSLPQKGPGRSGGGNFVLTEFEVEAVSVKDPEQRQEVEFAQVRADREQGDFPAADAIDGKPDTGWAPEGYRYHEDGAAIFVAAEPFGFDGGTELHVRMSHDSRYEGYGVGRFRLAVTDSPNPLRSGEEHREIAAALAVPPDERSDEQKKQIDEAFHNSDATRRKLAADLKGLEDEKNSFERSIPTTMVMRELDEPRDNHIHIRGDFLRKGDPVEPDVPAVLPPLPADVENATRLDLAKWLVDPKNPLTPRVTMNRVWMRYFGQGLVETEGDFGTQGTLPTHPELLDWLAAEFIDRGWSFKAMHKLIVMSATYRQSSHIRPDLAEIDPLNKLLARQSRFRVEAEIVRDLALTASGLLTEEIGGPSVHPPQPDGVYAFTQTKKNWTTSEGPDRYRRGMYTFFYRSAPYPMLTTFDAPRFETTCTQRVRSNTPLQALTMANDEALFEMAQALAVRVLSDEESTSDAERVQRAFRLCMARRPTEAERDRLLAYLDQQRERFAADPSDAGQAAPEDRPEGVPAHDAAAWTAAARVLMNLDEFITRE